MWLPYVELLRGAMNNTTRQVQLAIVSSLFQVARKIDSGYVVDFVRETNRILTPSMDVANYSALRIEALKVLVLLLKHVQQCDPATKEHVLESLRQVYGLRLEEFLRDTSPEVKSRADEAKRLLSE